MESRLASMEGDGDPAPQPKLKAGHRILSVPKRTTTATTTKGVARVSHVPTVDISKPLIAPDMKSKVPSGIRQRYLDSLVEECLKIYGGDKGDAYARATKEEQLCCDRSKTETFI
ncbi:REX1_ RNA exonuclease 1 -like protein (Silurana) [Caligus rogercresseyi]|uniref:REX1_ RNA exonuclease 1 -like protein (Silurana) n=1 Tax=Caligus rogercresseyi TaxID=217165 RepID=A0A7T8H1Z9_CALRO|nr:REX1_ RNA exonuclease 1 -like protein (Silurana) [Caligus rogercresseyi]